MEKRRDRAKLLMGGTREMCFTIMNKVFTCNGNAVLLFLLEALQCLYKLCYYFAEEFRCKKLKHKVECNSVFNPTHAQTVQMDCFWLVAEMHCFFKDLRPFVTDVKSEYRIVRITQIALVTSHFLQDFVIRNRDFHTAPPPPFKLQNKRPSVWRY